MLFFYNTTCLQKMSDNDYEDNDYDDGYSYLVNKIGAIRIYDSDTEFSEKYYRSNVEFCRDLFVEYLGNIARLMMFVDYTEYVWFELNDLKYADENHRCKRRNHLQCIKN